MSDFMGEFLDWNALARSSIDSMVADDGTKHAMTHTPEMDAQCESRLAEELAAAIEMGEHESELAIRRHLGKIGQK